MLDWPDVTLGEIATIKHGWPFKSQLFSDSLSGRPIVVSIGNFNYSGGFRFDSTTVKEYRGEYPGEYELSSGDVLVIMTCQTPGGEILGVPGRIPDDGLTYLHNQRMGKVVVTRPDLACLDFLYWVFLWRELNQEIVASASGTKIVHTAPSRIERFRFGLPLLGEQREIGRVLWALEDKIDLNRCMNRTLEGLAAATFKSWFVDFDPVAAKCEGRKPPAVSMDIAAMFPSEFVDSELCPIPRGWQLGTLGDIATNPRRGTRPAEIHPTTPYFGLQHLPRRSIALGEFGQAGDVSSGKFAFNAGEILFGKLRPYFHKVGIAPVDGVCSTDVLVVVPRRADLFGLVLGHVSSVAFIDHVDAASHGTRMPRTDWDTMSRYPIVLPQGHLVAAYSAWLNPMAELIRKNILQNRTLAALRDTLLPGLLSGEIRLKDAEKAVEQVV